MGEVRDSLRGAASRLGDGGRAVEGGAVVVGDVGNVLFGEAAGGPFESIQYVAEDVVEGEGDTAELELGEVSVE